MSNIDIIVLSLRGGHIQLLIHRRSGQLDLPVTFKLEETQQLVFCQPRNYYIQDATVESVSTLENDFLLPVESEPIVREVDSSVSLDEDDYLLTVKREPFIIEEGAHDQFAHTNFDIMLGDLLGAGPEVFVRDTQLEIEGKSLAVRIADVNRLSSELKVGKAWQCEVCGKQFKSSAHLRRHSFIHTGAKPYICDVATCDYSSSRVDRLREHKLRHHTGNEPLKRIDTGDLKEKASQDHFTRTNSGIMLGDLLGEGPERVLYGGQLPIGGQSLAVSIADIDGCLQISDCKAGKEGKCEVCGKQFKTSAHLRRHSLTHTSAKPYMCDVAACHYSSSRSDRLREHKLRHTGTEPLKRIHTGYKPFKCDKVGCSYSCARFDLLRSHKWRHRDTRLLKCDFVNCNFSCAATGTLNIHNRKHSGYKPYMCDFTGCSFRCTRSDHLREHKLRLHSGTRPLTRKHKRITLQI